MSTSFVHLHNHSHYSLLDGLSKPKDMAEKAKELGQPAIALTDHGNMMGTVDFYKACKKVGVKPIIGSEVYITKESRTVKTRENKRYHLVLLVKNKKGYENLMYMISQSFLTGFYMKPRIDYDLLKTHSEGLIALSACLAGEIPQAILKDDDYEKAKNIALNYEKVFGKDNFYLEIQHHPDISVQEKVNKEVIKISKELGIGLIATNDSHYINKEDDIIQDSLICINTGRFLDETEKRMCMMDGDYSLLSTEVMVNNFEHEKSAIDNSIKIADKCNFDMEFNRNLVPVFECPNGMTEMEFLDFLSDKGLNERYKIEKDSKGEYFLPAVEDVNTLPIPLKEIIERMKFEIETINKMGYPGYFLIVQDFIVWSKNQGILVGPGRGSAAGSLIAYLLKITNIDPLKYDLLFERFLNPDRISMPDIDIDFQDNRREEVLEYVSNKYGKENVCQVVTYQTMAAKNSVRDIGRVKRVPLGEVNNIATKIPSTPGTSLKKIFTKKEEGKFNDKDNIDWREFFEIYNDEEDKSKKELIDHARRIEGTIRGTGTHACAVIISGEPVHNYTPVQFPPKDKETIISQYEGPQLEDIGLLKMDFLGLRNLTIIGKCLEDVKRNHGVEIDIDKIPLDDKKTYKVFSSGNTHGIFQFESGGMRKFLKELKPDRLENLVAMNALYRPGPMEYIPDFIKRKNGKEEITYDHPLMSQILNETYGITVYQEQVMLLSRLLAGFTRGQSDSLRKAMGKKKFDVMAELKIKFVEGCRANVNFTSVFSPRGDIRTVDDLIEKIWKDWEAFTKYAFNKSHSVCYAYIAYQTAYLKANYPIEYMAAMLNSVKDDADKVLLYISECEKMEIDIIPPDVNHSIDRFSATRDGKISFGLSAIKNVGSKALESIIKVREEDGLYKSIYDFLERIDLSKANKRTLEFLIMAGALDSLGHKRKQIFTSLEELIPHFQKISSKKNEWTNSLFGESFDEEVKIVHPALRDIDDWGKMTKLEHEKEYLGFYISGHPLEDYKEIFNLTCIRTKVQKSIVSNGQRIKIGGMVTGIQKFQTKMGKEIAKVTVFTLYGEEQIMIFTRKWAQVKDIISVGSIYVYEVKVDIKDDEESIGLFFEDMKSILDMTKEFNLTASKVYIDIDAKKMNDEMIKMQFSRILSENRGDKILIFKITGSDNKKLYLKSKNMKISASSNFFEDMTELLGEGSVMFRE